MLRRTALSLSLSLGSLTLALALGCGSSGGGATPDGGTGTGSGTGAPGSGSGTSAGSGTGSGTSAGTGTGTAGGSGTGTGAGSGTGTSGGSGTGTGVGSGTGSGPFPTGTICNTSGQARTPPALVKHVMVFLFENENFGSVNSNSNAPYMSSLASACGYATHYDDNTFTDNLVSGPHYLALASGSNCNTGLDMTGTGCITDDNDATSHTLTTTSIFAQASTWKAYQESMPSTCDTSSSGDYACKHNPAAYYSTLSSCGASDVPIAAITCNSSTPMTACTTPSNVLTDDIANDTLPAFAFITPNLQNDMHNGTVTQGDNWLYTYMPLILKSQAYLNGEIAIFVLWDEQETLEAGGPIPNFFVSPYIKAGTVATAEMNHFSSLRAFEKMLGITTYLGCASGTISGGATCPPGSTTDMRAALNF